MLQKNRFMEFHTPEIEKLYTEIEEKRKQIIALKRAAPLEEIKNYSFIDRNGKKQELLDLFGDSDQLLLIHNMGKSCVYCTMWADGLRGYSEIISNKMPWVLTTPDDLETMKAFTEPRNWNYNVLSYHNTSFAHDLGFAFDKEGKKTMYWPGVSALIKKDGKIYRTGKDSFGPGDMYNPVWHFFDLFPNGSENWQPKYKY